MNQYNILIKKHVDTKTEAENFRKGAKDLGKLIARNKLSRTQVNAFRNTVARATKISDIINFLYNQIGRTNEWKANQLGQSLADKMESMNQIAISILDKIKNELPNSGNTTDKEDSSGIDLKDKDEYNFQKRRIALMLCREYAAQIYAHYKVESSS